MKSTGEGFWIRMPQKTSLDERNMIEFRTKWTQGIPRLHGEHGLYLLNETEHI